MDYQNNYANPYNSYQQQAQTQPQSDGVFGWDDEIKEESSFILLPDGDYIFTIKKFEKGRYDGGDKIPACPKAIVTFTVYTNDGQCIDLQENFLLHKKMEWKLSEFFASIGMKKKEWIESVNDDLPDFEDMSDAWENMPELAPPLIENVLRQGHKMLLAGPSKAGKSFALIELAIAIAEGRKWLGWQCAKGKVLYVNLELDKASCLHRVKDVYNALKIPPQNLHNLRIWNLRGISEEEINNWLTCWSWFHQSGNKKARILSYSTWVMQHIYYPVNWRDRFPEYYAAMISYQREGKNAHDDAPDATTGVAETMQMLGG